ncbi:MAG TPA: dienelactone hydrolase family protein [Candidatus Baltobacteraceae bacterium]|nr:dienelactone hydrolase family protein [Candidatus Baltobacteraceae bacterium]
MKRDAIDPVNSTSAEISRRGFTLLSSAALIGAAAPSPQTLGKPHPPFVAEDDPDITVSRPRLTPARGGEIGAYAASPRHRKDVMPGVVVIQAIWGVDAQLRDVVRRFAKLGYDAVAPALYDRLNPPSGDGAADIKPFLPVANKMFEQGLQSGDIKAAREFLTTHYKTPKAGIIGFCMGGRVVLEQIAGTADFAAASVFYGEVQPPPSGTISAAVLGSYGARDTSIKAQDARAFFDSLSAPHALKIYDAAGHAFFDDTRARYVESAANDAWQRTLDWFLRYLNP